MKIVCVRCAKTRDWTSGLCPGSRELRVGMSYASNGWELAVQFNVGCQIGGWTKITFHGLSREVGYDNFAGSQFFVGDPAGFNGDQAFAA